MDAAIFFFTAWLTLSIGSIKKVGLRSFSVLTLLLFLCSCTNHSNLKDNQVQNQTECKEDSSSDNHNKTYTYYQDRVFSVDTVNVSGFKYNMSRTGIGISDGFMLDTVKIALSRFKA